MNLKSYNEKKKSQKVSLLVFFGSFTFRLSDENINGPVDAESGATSDLFPTGFICGASGWTLNDLQNLISIILIRYCLLCCTR